MSNHNSIVLITGSNKGIGKATAKVFAENGYITYISARNEAEGLKAKEEISSQVQGSDVRFLKLDVTSTESIKSAVSKLSSETNGKLDILINNAGILLSDKKPSVPEGETLKKTFDINFFGAVETTQQFLPLLRSGESKVILNVSSDLGSLGLAIYKEYKFFDYNLFAYNSSKTALNAFTVALSKELNSEGFRVNSVHPGFVYTSLNGNGVLAPEVAGLTLYNTAVQQNGTGRFLGDKNTYYPW